MSQKRSNIEIAQKLKKTPKFYTFIECLDQYKILEDLDKSKEYTLFVPDNYCFIKDIKILDPMGDENIKIIIMSHVVPQKLTNLRVNHSYATLAPNKLIKMVKPKLINDKANIVEGPITYENFTLYCIDEVLF